MSEIKNIPDGWVETTLGKIIYFGNDKISVSELNIENYISTENLLSDKNGIVNSTILPNIPKVNKYEKEDTLFSNIRTYFKKVWYSDRIGGSSNDVLVFKSKDHNNLDKKFLYYFISSDLFIDFTVKSAKGTKMPRGDKNAMLLYNFNLPPLQEQQSIAQILTSFDDKIQLLQAQNKTLETFAQTIFTEWFGKNNDKFIITRLKDIISIRGGYSYKGNELGKGNSFLLGMGCVSNNNRFLLKGARLYSDDFPKTYLIQPGEIVLATRQQSENLPILGYPAIIPKDFKGKSVLVGTNLYMVKNNSFLNNEILFLLFKSEGYRNHILNNSKGTTVKMITKDSIENFEFKMPTKDEIDKCQNLIIPLIDKLKTNEEQIQSLTKTRDALLPRLMSGEIRIKV